MGSKEQTFLFQKIKSIAPNLHFIEDCRPVFMFNKQTGKFLEIDIYCEKYKFGFEYQGAIHFKNIHRYRNDSDNSRKNDYLKQSIIENIKGKISIIEIFEIDLKNNVQKNISERILNTANYYRNKENKKCNFLFNLYLGFKYSHGFGFTANNSHIAILDKNKRCIKLPLELLEERNNLSYMPTLKQLRNNPP